MKIISELPSKQELLVFHHRWISYFAGISFMSFWLTMLLFWEYMTDGNDINLVFQLVSTVTTFSSLFMLHVGLKNSREFRKHYC